MTATDQDEEPAPTSGEDAMFRAMFGDLMAEARAGRLTQREFQAACMATARRAAAPRASRRSPPPKGSPGAPRSRRHHRN